MIKQLIIVRTLFLFTLILMLSKTSFCQEINIHSIHTLRFSGFDSGYTLNGGRMRGSRAKLLNSNNFGLEGIYPKTIQITDDYIETESLTQITSKSEIDIFFFGAFDKNYSIPFSYAEIDSLYNWSVKGGKVIIATSPNISGYDFNLLNSKWGYEIKQYDYNNGFEEGEFLPTTEGVSSKIFNGPFGIVWKANQGGSAQGYFSSTNENVIILAKDDNGKTTLFLDCNTLDLICVDVDGYTYLGGVTDDPDIISVNDRFWANTIAYIDSLESQPSIEISGDTLKVGKYANYQWFFEGSPINGANSQFFIAEVEGEYKVEVTYFNGCGTISDSVNYIRLNDENNFNKYIIPNVITPNEDGKNDFLIIDNLPSNSELIIFNRIGNIVYHNKNYQNEWNGIDNNGNPLRYGTYWYVLKIANSSEEIKGNIFIKR